MLTTGFSSKFGSAIRVIDRDPMYRIGGVFTTSPLDSSIHSLNNECHLSDAF